MQQAVEREDFEEQPESAMRLRKWKMAETGTKKKLASVNDKDVDKPKAKGKAKEKSDGIRKEGFKKVKEHMINGMIRRQIQMAYLFQAGYGLQNLKGKEFPGKGYR